jgi:hypothetical protein
MYNIYHRYLKLPFDYPKPEIFNHHHHEFLKYLGTDIIDPGFQTWIESLGLTISNILEAFYTAPNGGSIPIHTDTDRIPGHRDVCKFNFTWGPANSVTEWYRVRNESDLILEDNTYLNKDIMQHTVPDFDINKTYRADRKNVDLVYKAVIDRPSLINISQLHGTYNPGTEHRWTLSFVLFVKQSGELLQFSEALDVFQDYIVDV